MSKYPIDIPEHPKPEEQTCSLGKHTWSVARLIQLAKDLPVMDVPIEHLNLYYKHNNLTLRDMVSHMEAVERADLGCPIILDEDGELMDGRHRIMKALLYKRSSIKAVRFKKNPPPCRYREEG